MTFLEGVEIKAICDIVRFRIDETTQLFKERNCPAPGLYRKWGCLEKSVKIPNMSLSAANMWPLIKGTKGAAQNIRYQPESP